MYLSLTKIKKIIISENSKIIDVANNLNASGLKITLIVDKNRNFLGVITDGDIRRALIKKLKVNDKVKNIINKKAKYINFENLNKKDNVFKFSSLDAIPVIKKKKIYGLFIRDYLEKNKNLKKIIKNPVVIMAGGFGKRLGNLTKKTPKAMLRFEGKPLLEHILLNAINKNFKNFYFSVFYLKEKIKRYFGNGHKYGINIRYIEENKPLGTIGALKYLNKVNNDFILTNCDVVTNIDFKDILKFHKSNKSFLTIAVKQFTYKNPYGVINSKGKRFVSFEEKPEIDFRINAGIYVFKPEVIKIIKKNNFKQINEIVDYISLKKYKILLFPLYEHWLDLGSTKNKLIE